MLGGDSDVGFREHSHPRSLCKILNSVCNLVIMCLIYHYYDIIQGFTIIPSSQWIIQRHSHIEEKRLKNITPMSEGRSPFTSKSSRIHGYVYL